jgi:GNAT superfamily N-acetyltransferase
MPREAFAAFSVTRSARVRIRRAWPHDAPVLSELALRAKAHWGYDLAEMLVFRPELTLAPEALASRLAHVLEAGDRLAGFYTLAPRSEAEVELEHLFVEPAFMGRGFGSELLVHAARAARRAGFARMHIQSDPHAEGFYRRRGASLVRWIGSSIPGREIPLFELRLAAMGLGSSRLRA